MEKIMTVSEINAKFELDKPTIQTPTFETLFKSGNFSYEERTILTDFSNAIKNQKENAFRVMYYCGLLAGNEQLLKKLGYKKTDFGKFCYDYFGIEKDKSSKYARVAIDYLVKDDDVVAPDGYVEKGKIHSVFAYKDDYGNYVDMSVSQLQELIIHSKYIKRELPVVALWSSIFETVNYDFKRLSCACLREYRKTMYNAFDMLPPAQSLKGFLYMKDVEYIVTSNPTQQPTPQQPTPQQPTPQQPTSQQPTTQQPTTQQSTTQQSAPQTVKSDMTYADGFEIPTVPEYTISEIVEMLKDHENELVTMTDSEVYNMFGEEFVTYITRLASRVKRAKKAKTDENE